jgi:hypothetical protein
MCTNKRSDNRCQPMCLGFLLFAVVVFLACSSAIPSESDAIKALE